MSQEPKVTVTFDVAGVTYELPRCMYEPEYTSTCTHTYSLHLCTLPYLMGFCTEPAPDLQRPRDGELELCRGMNGILSQGQVRLIYRARGKGMEGERPDRSDAL
jgi:hypothetical protein